MLLCAVLSFIGVVIQMACKIVKNVFLRGQDVQTKSSHYHFSAYLKHFTSVCVRTTNSRGHRLFLGAVNTLWKTESYPHSIINDSEEAGTDCYICWWLKFLSFGWQVSTIGFSRHKLNLFTAEQVLNLVQHNRAITINIICAHLICMQSCYPVVEIIQSIAHFWQ